MKQDLNWNLDGFYGRGWAFPPEFDAMQGAHMVSDLEDIHQSIQILFSTALNERVMRSDYGCDFHSAVFENISDDLIARLSASIKDSILRHEQRVELEDIALGQDAQWPSMLRINVAYRVRGDGRIMRLSGKLDIGDGRGRLFA